MTALNDDTAILSTAPNGTAPNGAAPESRDDDFAEALAKAAPRRWWNRGTVVLSAMLLLVGGFAGGMLAQEQWGTSATQAAVGNRAAGLAGGQNRAGAAGFGNPGAQPSGGATADSAAAATTGTVKLVNGTTIYVQTADGSVLTVKTDGRTTVATSKAGKLSEVKPGQSVTIHGATSTDGTMTATSVTAQQK